MFGDGDRLLIYFEHEEHLIRRLGAAVAASWRELDARAQGTIIERAEKICDEGEIDDFDSEMTRFLSVQRDLEPAG